MKVVLRLLGFLGPYRRREVLTYLCLLGSTAFGMAAPWLLKEAIDVGLSGSQAGFLVVAALAIIGASLLRGVFSFGQNYLVEYISQRVAYDLRNALYDKLQHLSFSYHDRSQTGQLMSRATIDIDAARMFISMGYLRLLYLVVLFVATAVLLVTINWRLALVSFAVLPLIGFRAVTVSRRLRPIWIGIQQEMANLGTILQENLSGVRVVRAFVQEGRQSAKFAAKAEDIYDLNMAANRQQAFNIPMMSFLLVASSGIILWYGGREVVAGNLSLGELVAFNSYLFMLAMPVRTLGWMVNLFSRAASAGERIFDILDTQSEVRDIPHARPLARVKGHVRFEGVSFSYSGPDVLRQAPRQARDGAQDAISVLKNIDLEAQPGESIALVGAAGSGKSTLVHLIPRFYDVSSGSITIDDIDIRQVTIASLRRQVGVVLQDPFLFSATIGDNIAYGKLDAKPEEIIGAATAARLHDFIQSLPDGYDTWVGERGITLSGGQKQRVAIARTLLLDPRILILDDATAHVDTETEHLIQEALWELMKGRTTFIIAQRLSTVMRADQILVLKDGEIVERGSHAELLEGGGIYREIYDLQFRGQEITTAIDS